MGRAACDGWGPPVARKEGQDRRYPGSSSPGPDTTHDGRAGGNVCPPRRSQPVRRGRVLRTAALRARPLNPAGGAWSHGRHCRRERTCLRGSAAGCIGCLSRGQETERRRRSGAAPPSGGARTRAPGWGRPGRSRPADEGVGRNYPRVRPPGRPSPSVPLSRGGPAPPRESGAKKSLPPPLLLRGDRGRSRGRGGNQKLFFS